MKWIIFGLVLFVALANCGLKTDEEIHRDAVVVENVPGKKLRAYEANVFPVNGPARAVQLKGIALEKNGNHGTIDAVEFDLNTILQATLAFGYFHAEGDVPNNGNGTADPSTITASLFAFGLRAFGIFEYDENNGVPGFQKDTTDTLNVVYDLSNIALQWKPLVANHSTITDKDGNVFKVWYITAETVDEVFFLRFIVSGTPLEVSGVHITPDSVKVDFAIRWFTAKHVRALWTNGPSTVTAHPNAQVGIACGFAALAETFDAQTTGASGSSDPVVTFGSAGFKGFFSWSPKADVVVQGVEAGRVVYGDIHNADATMDAAFKAGWIVRALYFSFEGIRPSEVAWDPQFGSDITYPSGASSASVNVLLVALFSLLVLFA